MVAARALSKVGRVASVFLIATLMAQLVVATGASAQPPTAEPPPSAGPPDEVSSQGKRHEIVAKRTETAKFFEEEDGRFTAELYSGPIHFEDDGKWHDIDTELIGTAESGWGWKNRAGPFSASFAETADPNKLVRLRGSEGSVAFGLAGANTSEEPVVEGSSITYPDVFPGVDLSFEVRNTDVKEVIILKQPPRLPRNGKAHYRFPLRVHGLRAVQEEPGGEVLLVDESGEAQFEIPKLWMNDSSLDPRSGEPAFSDDLSLTLVEHGNAQFLEVDVPAEWLLDPARVYPVYVDPTITPDPLTPSKDTFVQSNIFNTPQDGADELKIGTYDGSTAARSLVKFDVSSLRGKDLVSARFSLFNHWSWSCDPRVAEVYRITEPWSTDVTWSNKPQFAGTRVDSKNAAHGYSGCADARLVFEQVLEPVNYWLNHPEENHGFGIRAASETDTYGWKRFHSAQGSQKPHLVVEYQERVNQAPQIPTDLSPAAGTEGGTRPVLKARYRDQDAGDGGYVEFRMQTAPGGGTTVASGDGGFAEPNDFSTWSKFPSGKLVPGTKYYWQARSFDHNARSAWSDPISYNVAVCSTRAPNVPSGLQSTPAGYGGTSPTLSAVYSDPDNDAGTVQFSVYNGAGLLVTEGESALVASGTRASWIVPDGQLSKGQTYYWDARANDGCVNSGTTARVSYYVSQDDPNDAPYTPTNLSPGDGANVPAEVTLCGTFNDPDVGDGGKVVFQIFQSGVMVTAPEGSEVEPGQASCWTAPTGTLKAGTYQWNAYAHDGAKTSSSTALRSFTISSGGDWPPYSPTQLEPWNGTRSLNTTPDLSAVYNDVDTGDYGQVYFEIYALDAAGNRVSPPYDQGWGNVAYPQQRSTWRVTRPLEVGRDYQWRAIAWDGDQWGPWSQSWNSYSVTAPNQAPLLPTDLSPANPEVSSDTKPRLSGRYNDPDPGDFGYLFFEVWEVLPNGTRSFVWSSYSQYVAPGQMTHVDVPLGYLQRGKEYDWRANGFDDLLVSPSTAWRRYKILANIPPSVPFDLSPPDDTTSSRRFPILKARYHDSDADPGTITFDLFKVSGGVRSLEASHTSPQVASGTLVEWTVSRELFPGVEYEWTARARDVGSGLSSGTSVPRTYWVDAPPLAPSVLSTTHPDPNRWEASQTATFTWTGPADTSGIKAYSWELSQSPTTVPDESPESADPVAAPEGSATFTDLASGEFWFHVRARDGSDNGGQWGETAHRRIRIDVTPPGLPTISSSTHPDPNRAYDTDDVTFEWSQPAALSGVTGYSYSLDSNEWSTPDDESEGALRTAQFTDLEWGRHYFHVRALGGTGIWGDTATFEVNLYPLVDAVAAQAVAVESPIDVPVVDVSVEEGLVPPPPGGLSDLLPSGGLIGEGPLFDGELLPPENPADEVIRTFDVMTPPEPPLPNVGEIAAENADLTSTFDVMPLPKPFQLVEALNYEVHTVTYSPNGQVQNERTDPLFICNTYQYNSKNDEPPVLGTPPDTPLATFDLRIRFCPDATSFQPGAASSLTYDLDALKDDVNVKVTVTYAALGRRLHLESLAHDVDHPRDYQLKLSSQGATDAASTNVLDATSSGRLEEVALQLDRQNASGFTREGRITIHNLPAREAPDQRHRYVFDAEETAGPTRRQKLRIQLQNQMDNPSEALVIERFDPLAGGRLTARIKFDGIPKNFDTTLATEATGPARRGPDKVTISGTQPAKPRETLVVEQWNGPRLLGRGTIESFASDYKYVVSVLRDPADRENGLRFEGVFPDGRPDSGSFRLGRFHLNEVNNEDELEGLLQIDGFTRDTDERLEAIRDLDGRPVGAEFVGTFGGNALPGGRFKLARFRLNDSTREDERREVFEINNFAPRTSVTAKVDGTPGNPTGLHMNVTNRDPDADQLYDVPSQLIEILRTPANARRSRMILAGANVDESAIAPSVDGSNLRWDAIPRKFDLDITVEKQPSGVPSKLTLKNVSSNAPEEGRIRLTQDEGEKTLGFVVKAPTTQQDVEVHFRGTLANPSMARIVRINHQDRPRAALQFFQVTEGRLVSQLRFMGPEATMDGLVSGEPAKLDGVARNVPDKLDYGVELKQNAEGRPSQAIISGSIGSFARDFDVVLADNARNFRLHQRSFPETYSYTVEANKFDPAGRPRHALITGDQSEGNDTGLLDFEYRGMRFLMDDLSKTFSLEVSVQGPIDNPTGGSITQRLPAFNGGQVIQMIRKDPGADPGALPRAAITIKNAPSVLGEQATGLEMVWNGVPEDFDLDFGRDNVGSSGERIGVEANQFGDDRPGAVLEFGRTKDGTRQDIRIEGLAPQWMAKLKYVGELRNARELVAEVASTVRHASDSVRITNRAGGDLTHRVILRGNNDVSLPEGTPTDADAAMSSMPEAFEMRYKRVRDAENDRSQVVTLTNQRVVGDLTERENVANLDGSMKVVLASGGRPSEKVDLSQLPAHFRVSYDRPPAETGGDQNCLGELSYSATGSTLDLALTAYLKEGCAQGVMKAVAKNVPSAGFEVAKIHSDGSGRIKVAEGQTVEEMTLSIKAPRALREFVNRDLTGANEVARDFCKPFVGGFGCSYINVRANPQFENIRLTVHARELSDVKIATNVSRDGGPDPYPGTSDREEDEELWKMVPLMAVRNGGDGVVIANLSGDDDPTENNVLHQEVRCCLSFWKTTHHSMDFSLNRPLAIRFYTWFVKQGSCTGPNGGGPDAVKCNEDDQELRDDFGQNMHCGWPGFSEPIPFPPRFDAFSQPNELMAFPNRTMYFIPNLYDIFMSEPHPDGGVARWYARSVRCQTDWFFGSLLREYEPDLLRDELSAL